MKTLIALATGLMISFTVYAGSMETVHRDTKLVTNTFSSKSEALNAGFNMYESLETASNRQLRHQLPTFSDNISGDISIDSAQVRIEEIATSRDNTQYRAVLDVDYSYKAVPECFGTHCWGVNR